MMTTNLERLGIAIVATFVSTCAGASPQSSVAVGPSKAPRAQSPTQHAAPLLDPPPFLPDCAWVAQVKASGDAPDTGERQDAGCRSGVESDCHRLARRVEEGQYPATRALEAFRKACDVGQAEGCLQMGALYSTGKGVRKDPARAFAIFSRNCDAGYQSACVNQLGLDVVRQRGSQPGEMGDALPYVALGD
jgi:hypothetical protein